MNKAILAGDEDLTHWTDEELTRGQRRDGNGNWGGRPPKMVPTAVHMELTSRRMAEARELLKQNTVAAVNVLVEVAMDKDAPPADRVKAAGMILDRTLGRAPLNVVVTEEPPWAKALRRSTLSIVSGVIDTTAVDDQATG